MVSRRSDDSVVSRFSNGVRVLFETWRAVLTDAVGATARATRRGITISSGGLAQVGRVAELVTRSPGRSCGPYSPAEARTAATCGVIALLGGSTAAIGLALWGSRAPGALAAIAVVALWAPGRLAVMRVAAEPRDSAERATIAAAWGLGLLPFGLALWPVARVVAWVASAVIVQRAVRCGFDARDSRWILAWTFGIEVAAVFAAWLMRNLNVAVLVLGG